MAEGGGYNQVHLRPGAKPICDWCSAEVDNQLNKCLDCDCYICEVCKTIHNKAPALKRHTIISKVEREPKKIINTSKLCSTHPNEEILYQCSTCNDMICSECVIEIHQKHELIKINAVAKQKRKKLLTQTNTTKQDKISTMKHQITEFEKRKKRNDENKENNLQKIKNRREQINSELDKEEKELEAECIKIHKKNEDKMDTQITNLTELVSEMETMCEDFTKICHTGSDIEVIRAEQLMAEKLNLIQENKLSNMDTAENLPTFIEGKSDNKILKTMLGYLQQGPSSSPADVEVIQQQGPSSSPADVEVIHQFNYKPGFVTSICPLPDNTAFIHYDYSRDNDIVSIDGKIQQTIKFNFDVVDFIMTSQGGIMAAAEGKSTIYKLTKGGVITNTISTSPLYPRGLCETRDGQLLVSLVDKWSYNIQKSSRRCVSRITMEGKVLQRYEYDKGCRLFTRPEGVAENINGDVCVVNRTSYNTGQLIILDNSGQLKYTYKGQQLKYGFCPRHVKCDTVGNILVTDYSNRCVHMLNHQYQFVMYIITQDKMSDRPWSLAVDNKTGLLWIGGYEGNIYTIKYLK